ncbi:MAG: hypothetical protein FH748_02165 [Balneolaceae bacterium]|nr:hypothetical protein [Balneolaceae bacterium]
MHRDIRLLFPLLILLICSCEQSNDPAPKYTETTIYGKNQLFEPPGLGGEFDVGTQKFHWVDQSRGEPHTTYEHDKRELLVRIFYPASMTAGLTQMPVYDFRRWPFWETAAGRFSHRKLRRSNYLTSMWPVYNEAPINPAQEAYPLVIFSHGYGFSPEEHIVIASDLASRGFIVASINHPYGASRTIYDDGRIIYSQDLPQDNLGADLELWANDQIFSIDQVEALNDDSSSVFFSRVDMSKITTTGHSYGGAAAFHSAAKDTRIGLAVDIDGTIFNSEGKHLSIPFMMIQSHDDDSREIFEQVSKDGYEVSFNHAIEHHSFADYVLFWRWDFPDFETFGTLDDEVAFSATSEIMTQFMRKYHHGDQAPVLDDPAQTYTFTSVRKF